MTPEPKALLDEMLSAQLAVQLRARGFAVIAVVEDSALVSMADEDLLVRAAADGRCLVTANISDFASISIEWRASGRGHVGLVYVANRVFPQDRSFIGAVVGAVADLLESGRAPGPGQETYLRRASD